MLSLVGVNTANAKSTNSVVPLSSEFKNLATGKHEQLVANTNVASVVMIFQPDCAWCKKQGKLLASVKSQCQQRVNLSLLGYKGSTAALKRELKHFDKSLPAYKARQSFLRQIGGVKASPTTLFYDKQGQLLAKKRGYITPEVLQAALSQLTEQQCQWQI